MQVNEMRVGAPKECVCVCSVVYGTQAKQEPGTVQFWGPKTKIGNDRLRRVCVCVCESLQTDR